MQWCDLSREEIGYDVDLGVDLHWNFTIETAIRLGKKLAIEYHAREVPWWDDLVTCTGSNGPMLEDGAIDLPDGPGLGVEIDREVTEQYLADGSELIV